MTILLGNIWEGLAKLHDERPHRCVIFVKERRVVIAHTPLITEADFASFQRNFPGLTLPYKMFLFSEDMEQEAVVDWLQRGRDLFLHPKSVGVALVEQPGPVGEA